MKTAKTKAPARKAAKASRPSANAKASTKTSKRTPAKPASEKDKVARPVEVVKSNSKAAPRAAEIVTAPRDALTLPLKQAPTITAPIPLPTAVPPTPTLPGPAHIPAPRADVPPEAGFTLQVDGHFKNRFETLAQAKQAATDLKSRFPILRIEIYDAAKKARLPI